MQIANSIKFLLLLCYVFVAVIATYVFMAAFGLVDPVPEHIIWLTMAAFLVLCLSGVYWLVPLMSLSMNIRKPIQEEERLLNRCMTILQQKTGDRRHYRLRVIETNELAAFAWGTRTIAISKGLMYILEEEELIAIMAHEMAHLKAWDTFAGTGLFIAFFLPSRIQRMAVNFIFGIATSFLQQAIVRGIVAAVLGFILLLAIAYYFHVLSWIIALIVLGLFFLLLNWIFNFLYRADSRFTEYRRDAFAQRLGYGNALRTSLIKLIEHAPPSRINIWHTYFSSTHPITHNRIRKLGKMESKRHS